MQKTTYFCDNCYAQEEVWKVVADEWTRVSLIFDALPKRVENHPDYAGLNALKLRDATRQSLLLCQKCQPPLPPVLSPTVEQMAARKNMADRMLDAWLKWINK